MHTKFLKGKDHLEDLGVGDGSVKTEHQEVGWKGVG
jgi:hypothetical protein